MPIRVPSRRPGSPENPPGARDLGKRVLGLGEDPLGWSVPLASFFRLRLRLHVVFVAWIVGELIVSFRPDVHSPIHVAPALSGFLAVGLFRELVRFVVIRSCGIPNATLLLWPLGVVSMPGKADETSHRPEIPLAGMLASVMAAGITGSVLMLVKDDWSLLLVRPFAPGLLAATLRSEVLIFAWWMYFAAVVMALGNLLVPAPGFDLGRLLQALLSRKLGTRGATRLIGQTGLVVALVLFIVGATTDLTRVMAVAVLVAFVAFLERRRVAFVEQSGTVSLGMAGMRTEFKPLESAADPSWEAARPEPERVVTRRDPPRAPTPPAGIDDLLDKISRSGLKSLTDTELARLENERRRLSGERPVPPSSTPEAG